MPRQYKPDIHKKYDEEVLNAAIHEYQRTKNEPSVSLKTVADKYGINKSVFYRHCNRTMKKKGGPDSFFTRSRATYD